MGFLNEAKAESGTAWNGIWDEATRIAQTGSADMINAMLKAIREGKAPEEVEKMLQSIIDKGEPAGRKLGEQFGSGFASAVKSAAQEVASQITQGWDNTVGSAIGRGAKQKPTATGAAGKTVSVDTTAANTALDQLQAKINTIKQAVPIPINADISLAANQLQSLVATISSIRQSTPIPINADINPAASALQSLVATMSSIKQATPIPIPTNSSSNKDRQFKTE
jgi:hypothetical protein